MSGDGSPSPFRYVGLGFELIVPMILCLFIGRWIDVWLGTQPWFLLVGALIGMAAGFFAFFRTVLPPKGKGGATP